MVLCGCCIQDGRRIQRIRDVDAYEGRALPTADVPPQPYTPTGRGKKVAIADAGRARLSAMLCFEHPSLAGVDAPQDKLQVRHHVGLNFFRHKLEGEEEGKQHVLLLRVPGKPPSGGHSDYEEDETEGEEEEEEDSCINLRWWAKLVWSCYWFSFVMMMWG